MQFWEEGPWLTATISGNKIHMPLGQYNWYDENDEYGDIFAWGTVAAAPEGEEGAVFVQDNTVTEVTFTIQNDVITMDNSDGGVNGIGAVGLADMSDEGDAYYVEWGTTFTPFVEPTVITSQPEGELVTYTRSGYTVAEGSVYNQEGSVDIVYAPDGHTVYIRDIVFFDDLGTWVRGTIENGKLHVPLGQYIYCGNGYNFFIGWGQSYLNGNNEWKLNYDPNVTEATYTIDGGTITLDNSSFGPDDGPDGATGLVIVVDVEPDYFFQCEVLTQFYTPTAITEQPEGELVQYVRHGNWIYESGSVEPLGGLMDVVFAPDGQTVYIKDPIYDSQNGTWVMGTLGDDNIINVPVGQILSTKGKYNTVLAWGKMALNTTTWIYDFTPDDSKATIQYEIHEDNIYMLDGWNEAPVYHGPAAMQDGTGYSRGVEFQAYYTRYNGPTVITEQPAGDLVTYKRTGSAFYRNEELNKKGDRYIYAPEIKSQESDVNVVYAPDGQTVYLQDPVYCGFQFNRGTWVKGTLSDNNTKIHVPLGQYVSWDLNNETGDKLAWGSTSLIDFNPDDGYDEQELAFRPDFDMTEVTYTIDNGCIYLDNTQGGSYVDYRAMQDLYYNGDIDRETFEQMVAPWLVTSGLVYLDDDDDWTGEINWGTVYVSKHPTTLPDPVVNGWYDYNNENGNNRLEVEVPDVDTEGLPIFNDALSYSIYTDYDKLFTFEASKYGLDEDVTEVTYDMWQNNWRLRPECVYFYRTNAEGFEPFFKWRIGIQLHYTVDGVKQSSGIVYLEVFEKPTEPEVPGDVNGDSEFNISDVTNYINYILNDGAEVFYDENADFNNDGEINITDVIDMINYILNNI